ncbi:hypothetical protein AVEN_124726-1 [Araneus ventricosus]|uniref:Gustatory receptor n=1 Tax=Araneus ventricosus TaxID=182803 RepID=A0A4Y2GZC2_ARAVE|nr:hypothetical protein AVEN_124726-1 [Araneus ventricosus]
MKVKRVFDKEQFENTIFKLSEGARIEDRYIKIILGQFKTLIRLCQITGAPFSIEDLKCEKRKCPRPIMLYCVLLNLFRIVNFVFIANFAHFYFMLNSLLITFYAYNICALSSLFILSLRRRAVISAMKTTLKMAAKMNNKLKDKKWNMVVLVLTYAIAVLGVTASIGMTVHNNASLKNVPASIKFCGFSFESMQREKFLLVIKFSLAFTFFSSTTICGTILLLSSTVYFYLSETVCGFGFKLKKRFESKALSQISVAENICTFQKLLRMVWKVDKAFSTAVLFLYGSSVSCFFNALSVVFGAKKIFVALCIFAAAMFATSLGSFFLLTHAGNRVNWKFQELRNSLISCSSLALHSSMNVRELASFNIMVQDIRNSDMHLTGGDMFIIRKDMILTVAGVMISYGVLIFQLDKP